MAVWSYNKDFTTTWIIVSNETFISILSTHCRPIYVQLKINFNPCVWSWVKYFLRVYTVILFVNDIKVWKKFEIYIQNWEDLSRPFLNWSLSIDVNVFKSTFHNTILYKSEWKACHSQKWNSFLSNHFNLNWSNMSVKLLYFELIYLI